MLDPWTGELLSVVVGQGLGEVSFYGSPRVPELWRSGLDVLENMTASVVELARREVLRLAHIGTAPAPDANTAVSTQWLITSRDFGEPTATEEVWVVEKVQETFWPQGPDAPLEESAVPWEWESSIMSRVDERGNTPSSVPTKLYDIELQKVVPGGTSTPGARYITLSYVWTQWDGLDDLLKAGEVAAKHYGVRYLWCDRLCIDQDDAADIARQLPHMLRYYQHAESTLVLLPDVKAIKQEQLLYPTAVIDASRVAEEYGHLVRSILNAKWMTRIWTLQEALASRVLIFRTAHQYLDGNHLGEIMRIGSHHSGLICGSHLSQLIMGIDCMSGTIGSGHLWVRTGFTHALRSRWLDRGEHYRRLPFSSLPKYLVGRRSSREQDEIYGMMAVTQLGNVPVRYDWSVGELMDYIVDHDLAGYSVMKMLPHSEEQGECWRPKHGLSPTELSSWEGTEEVPGVEFGHSGRMVKTVGWLIDCTSDTPWTSASFTGQIEQVETSLHLEASVEMPLQASVLILRPAAAGGSSLTGVVMKPLNGEVGHFLGLCAATLVAAKPSDQLLQVREVIIGMGSASLC